MKVDTLPAILESVDIRAEPATVYTLVADVTRMGEWSPECWRCAWLGNAGPLPRPGDRFKGWNRKNRLDWTTICEVEQADGTELRFRVVKGALGRRTRWTYRIEPTSTGCRLTEICEPSPMPLTLPRRLIRALVVEPRRGHTNRAVELADDIRATLAALRHAAERLAATT